MRCSHCQPAVALLVSMSVMVMAAGWLFASTRLSETLVTNGVCLPMRTAWGVVQCIGAGRGGVLPPHKLGGSRLNAISGHGCQHGMRTGALWRAPSPQLCCKPADSHAGRARTLLPEQTWPLSRDEMMGGSKTAREQSSGKGEGLGAALGDGSGEALGDGSSDALGDGSGDAFGDTLGEALGDGSGEALGDGSGEALGDGSGEALGDGSGDALGVALGEALGDGSGDALGEALGGGFGEAPGEGLGVATCGWAQG